MTPDAIDALRQYWRSFWFAPGSSLNLGICRVLFFAAMFLFYLPHDFSEWASISPVFWRPLPLFRVLGLTQPSAPAVAVVQSLWKAALLLSCLGVCTRVSAVVAFVGGFYLLGLQHCFGKVHHYDAILVFALAVMAIARSGDAASVDVWLRTRRGAAAAPRVRVSSGEYTWPIRLMWVVVALVFFAAGTSKLREAGIAWVASDNLAIKIQQNYYHRASNDPLTSWGLVVAQSRGVSRLLALTTVVIEIAAPLTLFSRTARLVLVPALLAMLICIRLLLGPSFAQFAICFVFWVPWDRVVAVWSRW